MREDLYYEAQIIYHDEEAQDVHWAGHVGSTREKAVEAARQQIASRKDDEDFHPRRIDIFECNKIGEEAI
ncbi:hypothetical protein LCGC14_2465280 [marine sediment metagenome]|uniref:DUF2188 domain-containing protein n=1 Tax=marine sediment metagenome TaxID=412755 RepID=A0A0F9E5X2_9ZZZZ